MRLYPYQERVKNLVTNGRSVILQAPTGAGKTIGALGPFVESFFDGTPSMFPRKCIYSVPMRVLANQFALEYTKLAESYQRRHQRNIDVRIQTGENAQDPQLLGNLTFATIDQSLSSALAVPYSQGLRRANLNAGAFFSSYLVFDEFHLFPTGEHGAQGALVTTLQLLSRIKGIVPFVLMTATFSSTMLEELADQLDAEVITVPEKEYQTIAAGDTAQPRRRIYHMEKSSISAESILRHHHQDGVTRSIAICNQVGRAQNLYQELHRHPELGTTEVMLIHSRFMANDRKEKEELLQREFGKQLEQRTVPNMILVATQVIEVGVDITCDRMHTEIAPANAVFQRAGRCARYPGEEGHVFLYPVPERDDHKTGLSKPDYLPYPRDLCEKSRASFSHRDDSEVDFLEEQRIVDEVHTDSDRALLAAMQDQSAMTWNSIFATMETHDTSLRSELIRNIDSVTLVAGLEPEDVGNPFGAEGFSLHRGSIKGLWRRIQEYAHDVELEEFADPLWTMAYPLPPSNDDSEDVTKPTTYRFHHLGDGDESFLDVSTVIVVNSRFCAYDADVGFRIVPPGEYEPWISQPGTLTQGNRPRPYAYRLESYEEHIQRMAAVYEERFQGDYAYVQARIAERWKLPADALDQAVRLAVAGHDIAKLEHRWQRWVRAYQQEIGRPIEPTYMAVHTDSDPYDPSHQAAQKVADRVAKRPNHAGEGSVASARLAAAILRDRRLTRAVITAIARHHSSQTGNYDVYELHPLAENALEHALNIVGVTGQASLLLSSGRRGGPLDEVMVRPGKWDELLLYFWIVRMLRLCDGLSQE